MSEDVTQLNGEGKKANYWKSLNQLAKNDEYKKFVDREFPEEATELTDKVSRRSFLRVMGASIALAGFASCRRPVQKILPYSNQPEEVIPGEPLYYASAMPFQDALTGIVVENHEGRPTKIEGNEMHPASSGSSSIFNQGAILNMYDPDRSRYVRRDGERSSYNEFLSFCKEHFSDTDRNIAFISEANSSPTYNRLRDQALDQFSNAQWVTYEPFGEDNALEGTNIAFGERLRTVNHFDQADVIVALDDDFLNPAANKNSVQDTRNYTQGRKVESPEDNMTRFYAIESTFSMTGSNADNRLRLKSSEIELFLYALAAELSGSVDGLTEFSGYSNKFTDHDWIGALAEDLLANQGSSVLTVGNEHAPSIHATVAALNQALGNAGNTVTYHEVPYLQDQYNKDAFESVVSDLQAGNIDTVVLVGTNPAFTAPADLNFSENLQNANTVIHLADYYDETSKLANWHINRAHFLEAWSDGYSFTGTRSIVQPQIEPLFSGISDIEFLNSIVTSEKTKGYDLVQETWNEFISGSFQSNWERILHDGLDEEATFPQASVDISSDFQASVSGFLNRASETSEMEVVIRPDSKLYDGRYANNGWLQELPDPMTKITWDNVALMSKATAEKLGIQQAGLGVAEVEKVSITIDGTTVEIPAWVQPGHADDSITITVGYGREGIGKVANQTGIDTYPLRKTGSMLYATDVSVENAGGAYEIACTQDHNSMEGRSLLRHATLQEYREEPEFASYESSYEAELPGESYAEEKGSDRPMTLFDSQDDEEYPDYEPQWGMTIDLNSCIGCGACTVACQAENNIPVVGKREVSNGREMHWIRNDRYFEGDVDDPQALHQPVPCMHCELAPCEQVCPVAATTHSDDGMNQMTYNRCIGTRYCANNCPYKVRRFNFFNYTKEYLTTGDDPEVVQMAMNPDVTVRFRGVMEKCTYCVQRVNKAKIEAKKETGSPKPEDGAVQTACQQACPAKAIEFGDLTDDNSKVVEAKSNERNYLLLEEVNTRPRTSYLAKLRNPNPKLA
ncbi:TAT-variant-translocated molybdopterin oxidoreductase [Aliifodinibius sp. S!AR15-10]|uniref:TAT-variant-translocated molybdopterin oxidoreductase n=1 Tax=Aliifodinibius sp. S!AR15-10 TaxID=2950437 RepID=UPI002860E84C|nr:TAT-variant-translocated molybdopterin oxidoreductase [Aliifodinibius sp. S!AR15-10]MDR8393218.1 TAT-variant-translocated molybdopterin oxidoreductase [Aliifodinibius sp. S!AR15-10]